MRGWRSGGGLALIFAAGLGACHRPGPLSAAAHRPAPPQPAWAAPLAGRRLADAFPGTARCDGSVDRAVEQFHDARRIVGWAWNATRGAAVARVAVVGPDGRMAAFGEGGGLRPDVPAARPEVRSGRTGWQVVAPTAGGRQVVFGLDEAAHAACRIGDLRP